MSSKLEKRRTELRQLWGQDKLYGSYSVTTYLVDKLLRSDLTIPEIDIVLRYFDVGVGMRKWFEEVGDREIVAI